MGVVPVTLMVLLLNSLVYDEIKPMPVFVAVRPLTAKVLLLTRLP